MRATAHVHRATARATARVRRVTARVASLEHPRATCYCVAVLLRHAALAAGGVLVLGLGVYLFLEVRARPAAAQVTPSGRAVAAREAEHAGPATDEAEARGGGPREGSPAPAASSEGRAPDRPGATSRGAIASAIRERPSAEGTPPDKQPHKLAEVMDEANKAYDRGDLDEAKAVAQKVLATSPDNVRMLRIVVSAACISGDTAEAQKAYLLLPSFDREQMKTRCGRYGVSFHE